MFRKLFLAASFLWVSAAANQPKSWALTFTDTIIFGNPLAVVDTVSGNASNFHFTHSLWDPGLDVINLLSGTLSLTHSSNANVGPTAELWSIFFEDGTLLGGLSTSQTADVTDQWSLSLTKLEDGFLAPFEMGFALTELTSFNSERLDLYQSVLEVEYELIRPAAPEETFPSSGSAAQPSVPEPSTLILVGTGAAAFFFKRRPIAG